MSDENAWGAWPRPASCPQEWLIREGEVLPVMRCPVESDARKDIPLARGLFDYFPDALVEVAKLSMIGNDKHNPGQPLHWSRDKSTDHADCILRHMLDRGKLDTDGLLHDVKVAWRALAQLQLALEARRPPTSK